MELEGNLDVLPMFKDAVGVVREVRHSSWNCDTASQSLELVIQ